MSTEPESAVAERQQVITANEVAAVRAERKSLVATFADKYGIEPNRMMATLRATVIRPAKDGTEASNEQIASFLVVANQHNLNPFTKEIHAFLGRQGSIVCVVGLDGWAKKVNEHPAFDGMDFEQDDEKCTCTIHRKDRSHPVVVTEYHKECFRPNSEPWATHPKRMLRHKALIQCARLAFSFAGIYDPDEAERIVQAEEIDVTPVKLSPKRLRELAEGMLKAVADKDRVALTAIYDQLSNDERLALWPHLRSYERSGIKALLSNKALPDVLDLEAWSIETLTSAKDADALLASWDAIQGAYQEADQLVPEAVESAYSDRKQLLGLP